MASNADMTLEQKKELYNYLKSRSMNVPASLLEDLGLNNNLAPKRKRVNSTVLGLDQPATHFKNKKDQSGPTRTARRALEVREETFGDQETSITFTSSASSTKRCKTSSKPTEDSEHSVEEDTESEVPGQQNRQVAVNEPTQAGSPDLCTKRPTSVNFKSCVTQPIVSDADDDETHQFPFPSRPACKPNKAASRRIARREQETPYTVDDSTSNDSIVSIFVPKKETDLVLVPGRKMCLLSQQPIVKDTIHAGIKYAEMYLMFHDSYPEMSTSCDLGLESIKHAAHGNQDILNRITYDPKYGEQISKLPHARISNFRSGLGSMAVDIITSQVKGVVDAADILKPIVSRREYIYPINYKTGVVLDRTKYYRNPELIVLIHDYFFSDGSRAGTIAVGNRSDVQALFPMGGSKKSKNLKPQLPIPCLALCATAMHYALSEVGTPNRKDQFTNTRYYNVYNTHVTRLKKLAKENRGAYHALMSDLYALARSGSSAHYVIDVDPLADADFSLDVPDYEDDVDDTNGDGIEQVCNGSTAIDDGTNKGHNNSNDASQPENAD